MPMFLVVLLVVFGGWYGWKAYKRESARIDREVREARRRTSGTLEQDPSTGKYRPKSGPDG